VVISSMPAPLLDSTALREIIADHFQLQPSELQDETALFSSGLLDSFHLVELIAVLEKASGRRIKPGEINLENLDTPARIARFLASSAE
jgi:acyl carrier protein